MTLRAGALLLAPPAARAARAAAAAANASRSPKAAGGAGQESNARRATRARPGAAQKLPPIRLITSRPSTTAPNTTCLPSHCGAGASVKKNWLRGARGRGAARRGRGLLRHCQAQATRAKAQSAACDPPPLVTAPARPRAPAVAVFARVGHAQQPHSVMLLRQPGFFVCGEGGGGEHAAERTQARRGAGRGVTAQSRPRDSLPCDAKRFGPCAPLNFPP